MEICCVTILHLGDTYVETCKLLLWLSACGEIESYLISNPRQGMEAGSQTI